LAIVFEHARVLGGQAWVEDANSGGALFVVSMNRSVRAADQGGEFQ
jgi:hypothetical protein